MHQNRHEPMRCPHCAATTTDPVRWIEKASRIPLCDTHAQLARAVKAELVPANRSKYETRYRALAAVRSVWANRQMGEADRPANWTHEAKRPGRHNKIARGNVPTYGRA